MTQPADWGFRFQELAGDAGQMYARSLRRYHEVLERVGGGQLKPEQVQTQFRDYLQEQGSHSTRELVELSVGLLAGLLYVEAKYREALLDGLLPADGPLPASPEPSGIDITNWFQTLAAYATEQNARGMARHQQLVERVAAGEISPSRVQDQGRRFLEEHAPRLLGDVMDLGLDYVERLQHSSAALADALYDRVLGPDPDASGAPSPPVCVDLRGPSGAVVSAEIVVENRRPEPAHVVCRASEFAPRAGGPRFLSALEIVPGRFALAPREQRDVRLRLPLDPALFAPDVDYVATVRITGAGADEMIVQLFVRALTHASSPPGPRSGSRGAAADDEGQGEAAAPARARGPRRPTKARESAPPRRGPKRR